MKNPLVFFLLLSTSLLLQAQNPSLDPNFNENGKYLLDFTPSHTDLVQIAVQEDKKILLLGDNRLIRLNPDHGVDEGFGDNGEVEVPFGNKVYVHPNGKIIIAGTTNEHEIENVNRAIGLIMLNTDGSIDTQFGDDGIAFFSNSVENGLGYNSFTGIGFQSDGSIIIIGGADVDPQKFDPAAPRIINYTRISIYKLDLSGDLDVSFGTNGIAEVPIRLQDGAETAGTALDFSIQSDDKITVVGSGTYELEEVSLFAIARVNSDGSIDEDFNNGENTIGPGSFVARLHRVILREDGRIFLAGYKNGIAEPESYFLQLTQDGLPDINFGENGIINFEHDPEVIKMILLPDHHILLSTGARVTPEGNINNEFTGQFFDEPVFVNDMALQNDAKLLVTGTIIDPTIGPSQNFIARIAPIIEEGPTDPEPTFPKSDMSFGDNGTVNLPSEALEIAIQADRKILSLSNNSLTRFLPDGEIDANFGDNGHIALPFDYSDVEFRNRANHPLHSQPDNKTIIIYRTSLFRYNEDGSPDTGFGENGTVDISDYTSAPVAWVNDIHILTDGKIIVATTTGLEPNYLANAVGLNADGSLNTEFGENGKFTAQQRSIANTIAAQPDGNLIISGREGFDATERISIFRISPEGQLDGSFNNGYVTPFSQFEPAADMVILKDGRILIGSGYNPQIHAVPIIANVFMLAMLDQDGNVDQSFGTEGRMVFDEIELISEDEQHWHDFIQNMLLLPDDRVLVSLYERPDILAFDIDGQMIDDFQGINGNTLALQEEEKLIIGDGGILKRFLLEEPDPEPQNPRLDITFGENGAVDLQFQRLANEIATLPDNKILVLENGLRGGTDPTGANNIYRLLPDGEIDLSFGENGRVSLDFNLPDWPNNLFIQPDHKFIIKSQSVLRRFNENGSIDSDFGENGVVYLGRYLDELDDVRDLIILPDMKIAIAGSVPSRSATGFGQFYDFAAIKLNEDGSLDTSFGEGGSIIIHETGMAWRIRIQPDGNLIILGSEGFERYRIAIARINPDGQMDPDFNNGNTIIPNISQSDLGVDMVILDNGKIVIGSTYTEDVFSFLQLVGLDQDGNLDMGFGQEGRALFEDLTGPEEITMAILPDGKILVSFFEIPEMHAFFQDGTKDENFGGVGGYDFAIQGNSRLLTASFGYIRRYILEDPDPQPETPSITRLTLINAQTNEELFEIEDGQVINLQEIGTNEINIRAYTDPEPTGSVRFVLTGAHNRTHIENVSYYALFANDGDNFFSWQPPLGDYQLTATPYAESGAQGEAGTTLTVSFSIIDEEIAPVKVERLALINASTNQELFEIEDGQVINLQEIGTNEINIRAYTDPEPTGSVRFVLTGTHNRTHIENVSYYALFANDGENFFSWQPPLGDYQLTTTPYTESGAQGEAGAALTVSFSIINEEVAPVKVERLTLINAQTNQELFEIEDGQVINLQEIGTNEINIRAYTDPEPTGSVRFQLSGPHNRTHIENVSYYALFANDGEDFFSWQPPLGHYNLNVTPFTEIRAQGEEGTSMAISFSIVDESPEAQRVADVFPNPGTSTLFIPLQSQNPVKVLMFDLAGKQVMNKVSLNHYEDRVEINVNGLESKAYIIQLVSDKETRNIRWMKE